MIEPKPLSQEILDKASEEIGKDAWTQHFLYGLHPSIEIEDLKDFNHLILRYINATETEQSLINDVSIALIGWGIDTIIIDSHEYED